MANLRIALFDKFSKNLSRQTDFYQVTSIFQPELSNSEEEEEEEGGERKKNWENHLSS